MESNLEPSVRLLLLITFLAMTACETERVTLATKGSPSADAAALAGEIEQLSVQIQERALAIQALADPEAMAGGGPPPDLETLRAEIEQLRARREELGARLSEMERLATNPSP